MPNPEVATYYPRGVNAYVANAQYHSEVQPNSQSRCRIQAPVAANPAGYFSGVSLAAALVGYNTYATPYTVNQANTGVAPYTGLPLSTTGVAQFGRGVSITASGAYTGVITVHGRDYLGQPMSEAITGNGATQANGKKAFAFVDSFDAPTAAAGVTLNIGWTDLLGLQFNSRAMVIETVNYVATANPGTFVSSNIVSPQTLTAADPKGTYTPNAANATNGANTYQLLVMVDKGNLYGVQHSYT